MDGARSHKSFGDVRQNAYGAYQTSEVGKPNEQRQLNNVRVKIGGGEDTITHGNDLPRLVPKVPATVNLEQDSI
jgi:hypothetical protein